MSEVGIPPHLEVFLSVKHHGRDVTYLPAGYTCLLPASYQWLTGDVSLPGELIEVASLSQVFEEVGVSSIEPGEINILAAAEGNGVGLVDPP